MRRSLVVGNWKMNGSKATAVSLLTGLKARLAELNAVDVCVCPPFLYLSDANAQLADSAIRFGAQDVSGNGQDNGAYTGEVSAAMLSDAGCEFAIVGHSERREYFAESADLLAKKVECLLAEKITPILCVGEKLDDRESGLEQQIVEGQLHEIVDRLGVQVFSQMVVAYEPVWAIGTGKTATPEQAQQMHAFIRGVVSKLDPVIADKLPLLYGGSVKPDNAKDLFAMQDIDGALVGGACLDVDSFSLIIKAKESV
ncbi:MAG: triose-phosphate isomerase [Cellvibrionales bacterium]|nr:triose-phosphate isomerase [Cellvibrionales bacterium]